MAMFTRPARRSELNKTNYGFVVVDRRKLTASLSKPLPPKEPGAHGALASEELRTSFS